MILSLRVSVSKNSQYSFTELLIRKPPESVWTQPTIWRLSWDVAGLTPNKDFEDTGICYTVSVLNRRCPDLKTARQPDSEYQDSKWVEDFKMLMVKCIL